MCNISNRTDLKREITHAPLTVTFILNSCLVYSGWKCWLKKHATINNACRRFQFLIYTAQRVIGYSVVIGHSVGNNLVNCAYLQCIYVFINVT